MKDPGATTLETLDIAREIVNGLEDKKAENIVLLDLRPQGQILDNLITDYFIIATGNSDRQIKALVENVRDVTKILYDRPPSSVEGDNASGWVLMDYGDVIVHIMTEEKRNYYDLEGLYRLANVLLSIQ